MKKYDSGKCFVLLDTLCVPYRIFLRWESFNLKAHHHQLYIFANLDTENSFILRGAHRPFNVNLLGRFTCSYKTARVIKKNRESVNSYKTMTFETPTLFSLFLCIIYAPWSDVINDLIKKVFNLIGYRNRPFNLFKMRPPTYKCNDIPYHSLFG